MSAKKVVIVERICSKVLANWQFDSENKLLPFVAISLRAKATFPSGDKWDIFAYGAKSAFGLIGSESNGVAVCEIYPLREVIADELGEAASGWSGPSAEQKAIFADIVNWLEKGEIEKVCCYINDTGRNRKTLSVKQLMSAKA